MDVKLLFAPITKVDAANRTVSGFCTLETPDKRAPIPDVVDYESFKVALSTWVGNIREMHLPIAVGKGIDVQFDDAQKGVYLTSYISQSRDGEDAWTKVGEKVLTGYSIGPSKFTRTPEMWTAPDGSKTMVNRMKVQEIAEISLVDNPMCPGTTFDSIKAMLPDAPEAGATEAPPPEAKTPPVIRLLVPGDVKMTEAGDIARVLPVLQALLDAIRSKQIDQSAGEQKVAQLTSLQGAFQQVQEFITQEFADLVNPQAPSPAGAAKAEQPAETKATAAAAAPAAEPAKLQIPDTQKVIDAALDGFKAVLADAVKDLAGKGQVDELAQGLGQVTAATGAAKAGLADVTQRVTKLETSPAPGGPVLRTEDLASKGLHVVEKGGEGPAADGAKAVLADIEKRIDTEKDPRIKEALGQTYTALAIKYRV